METITSRQNARFREIKKLIENKRYREETGSFFVDGVNFVAQALANNWEILSLVYVPSEIDTDYKKKILSLVPDEKHFPVDKNLYEALSVKKDVQGVGGVFKQKLTRSEILPGTGVVLENIANPGNLGSIARLCAAFGINNLYIIKPAVEFFHPEVVRASMGGLFHLNLVEFDSIGRLSEEMKKTDYFGIGTSLQDDSVNLSVFNKDYGQSERILVLFGSEAKGLSTEAKNTCQTLLRIPIHERVDSLNVAESAAIVLYELFVKK